MNNNEIKQTNEQIILSYISIGTVIISIILLYNDKEKAINKHGFIDNKAEYNISLINRFILFIIFLAFLIINYQAYEDIKKEGKESPYPYQLQLYASVLTLIATLIALYVSLITPVKDDANIENPII